MMQCAEIVAAFQPLRVTSRPVPVCPDGGVLVRTLYAGMCHSDLHIIDDEVHLGSGKVFRLRDTLGDKYKGIILGHEICGQVVEIGASVPQQRTFNVGDTVVVYAFRGCTNCEICLEGQSQLCENNMATSTEIGQGGHGGGYGSYVAVPEWQLLVKLPGNIDASVGCMLPCSALTAYNTILRAQPSLDLAVSIRGHANLLVIGCGGLGLWVLTLVKSVLQHQHVRVICADTQKQKLSTATEMGADDVILIDKDSTEDDISKAMTKSGGKKLDAAIDFVGHPKTTFAAYKALHNGGTVVVVGFAGGEMPLSLPMMISKSTTLTGVRVGPIASLRELVRLVSETKPQVLPPTVLISLQEVNNALDNMRKGTLKGRYIIKHHHE